MKSRVCFALIVLSLFAFVESLYAQTTQSQFGYVNVADAVLLHPTMRNFDIKTKLFKLEALKGINREKRTRRRLSEKTKKNNSFSRKNKKYVGKRKK